MNHFLTFIHASWHAFFISEFQQPYIDILRSKLNQDHKDGRKILPPYDHIFRLFQVVPLDQVKVVILGQDPYHGVGQAHGLSFSVPTGVTCPPSLVNIYKEIESDCHVQMNYKNGDLTPRATQGVFLLNASLTTLLGQANAHADYGWQIMTDRLISYLSDYHDHLVYMLWGNFAKKKVGLIDQTKHIILTTSHPSPLSAYQGFVGCHHFSQCNKALQENNILPIQWAI